MKHSKKQTKNAGKPSKGATRKARKSAASADVPKTARARARDPRLPAVGTTIVRPFKGREIRVEVLDDGFRMDGKHYRSLTAAALQVTGYPAVSGPAVFGLTERPAPTPKAKPAKSKSRAKGATAENAAPEAAPVAESPAN